MIKKIAYCSLIFLLSTTLTSWAVNKREEINQLQQQIQSLKSNLKNEQGKREDLEDSLKESELKLGRLKTQNNQLTQQLQNEQKQLATLKAEEANLEKHYKHQLAVLSVFLRSAYLNGQNEYLKMLLNLDDPTKINRLYIYHQYLVANRLDLLQDIKDSMMQLTEKKAQIASNTEKLNSLQKNYQQQQHNLTTLAKDRQNLLQTIDTHIQNKTEKLNKLLASKQALEEVMQRIDAKSKSQNLSSYGNLVSFDVRAGQLPWPTRGRIAENFGSKVDQSQVRLNGVIIGAPEGQPVYAIAPGRVVFSDWLVGYGLLVIVDHGKGLMTLYGRNATLNKKTGDRVKTGDQLAQVGNSGGYSQSGLYFAIRQNGKPVNPHLWCGSTRKMGKINA